MPSDMTRLDPVDVMYVCEYEKPSEEAFAELEAAVGLKGRRFYGVFDEGAKKYWACVQRREQVVGLSIATNSLVGMANEILTLSSRSIMTQSTRRSRISRRSSAFKSSSLSPNVCAHSPTLLPMARFSTPVAFP